MNVYTSGFADDGHLAEEKVTCEEPTLNSRRMSVTPNGEDRLLTHCQR
jgi:hypothetical protein